jgi:protein-tyrosine phosphatase
VSASRIVGDLYVGAAPPPGNYADQFDVIVLTADEYQPAASMFPGVRLRHHPFDDSPDPQPRDLMTAWTAAEAVAQDMRRGRRVLVSCRMGRNRSGLVAALALHLVTGESGAAVLALVRERRVDDVGVHALSNRAFQRFLRTLPAG